MNNKKFVIYYEPPRSKREYLKSITLTISRINPDDNTYKIKLLQEHISKTRGVVEEYKMKEIHLGANEIIEKIEKVDFERNYSAACKDEKHDYFYISYGDKTIETSNIDDIEYILEEFCFNDLISITHKHYEYIKDMYEYTELVKILNNKINSLSGEQLATLSRLFKPSNPYLIFQSMAWLPEFLNDNS